MAEAFGGAEAYEGRAVDGADVAGGFEGAVVGSGNCGVLLLETDEEVFWEVCGDEFLRDVGGPWCLAAG